jgi:hypothetical protein
MNGLHPYNYPDLYRAIVIGDFGASPGVVTLSGHDREEQWDVQAAKGQTGATSTHGGKPIGQFQASFYFAGDEDDPQTGSNDFVDLEDFRTYLASLVAGSQAKAVPIYHPDLARNGFTEVSVASIGGIVWDDRGGATMLVKFIESRPAKPAAVKPAVSKGGSASKAGDPSTTGKPTKPDPNAAAKKELSDLVDEAKKP